MDEKEKEYESGESGIEKAANQSIQMRIPIEAVKVSEVGPVEILENAKDDGGYDADLKKPAKFKGNQFRSQRKNEKQKVGGEADEV